MVFSKFAFGFCGLALIFGTVTRLTAEHTDSAMRDACHKASIRKLAAAPNTDQMYLEWCKVNKYLP
jgi:hypothetical protein